LSAFAAARVRRRSGFSSPMPGVRGRPNCRGKAVGRSPRTPIRFDDHWLAPQALDKAGLVRIHDAHANAARRADRVGFDLVELFAAHGFLLDSFLSPIANRRTDSYGGSLANRMRYPLEVAAATREAWPRQKPLSMRITGCDWVDSGITTDEAGIFASELRAIGSITSAFPPAASVRRRGLPSRRACASVWGGSCEGYSVEGCGAVSSSSGSTLNRTSQSQ